MSSTCSPAASSGHCGDLVERAHLRRRVRTLGRAERIASPLTPQWKTTVAPSQHHRVHPNDEARRQSQVLSDIVTRSFRLASYGRNRRSDLEPRHVVAWIFAPTNGVGVPRGSLNVGVDAVRHRHLGHLCAGHSARPGSISSALARSACAYACFPLPSCPAIRELNRINIAAKPQFKTGSPGAYVASSCQLLDARLVDFLRRPMSMISAPSRSLSR